MSQVAALQSPARIALRKTLSQPAFVVVALVLLIGAVGLNGATRFLKLHFKKLPAPMARPFNQIPGRLGPWAQVSEDGHLQRATEEELGTHLYLYRDYMNVEICGEEELTKIKSLSGDQLQAEVTHEQVVHPDGVINVGLTYYTGLVDTVAHIPDRCYIADGFQPTDYDVVVWPLGQDAGGKDRSVEARFIKVQDQTGAGRVDRNVAYFFHVNGHYQSDPLAVRASLQNLLENYGYYSKVELMTVTPKRDLAAKGMTDFLTWALPEIQKSFPDWAALHRAGKN